MRLSSVNGLNRLGRSEDVECAFGILKMRFRILLNRVEFHSLDFIDQIFHRYTILHNLLVRWDGREILQAFLVDNKAVITCGFESISQLTLCLGGKNFFVRDGARQRDWWFGFICGH